ncbi:hypothetical protein BDR06DRAFT_982214 [Suillus hirtellus]|nr:hypothetical protein BDR06DRAFT_982214 [Suillus hirtellus]
MRANVFLPAWSHYQPHMQKWKKDDITLEDLEVYTKASSHHLIVWVHDKSTFYANDWRKEHWVYKSEHAIPLPKGEGASLMVADFVSADYGWLCSPDRKECAWVLFKAGKARDGYFTNEEIITQAANTMDILEKYFSNEDHIFIFDNATTHLKCVDDALCAHKMLKGPSATWGISVKVKISNGHTVVAPDGKPIKEKIQMVDAQLPNGDTQSLYFPDGHQKARWFKGTAQILYHDFKCPKDRNDCCCQQLLYTQPDFMHYHCNLNFIGQCWGYAKRLYQKKDCLSSKAVLECNVLDSLDAVPLSSMQQFTDAYQKGLNRMQAAWAIKNIMKEFDDDPSNGH